MKELHGTASAVVSAPPEKYIAMLAAIEAHPDWYPDGVREVETLERDAGGQPTKVRTKLQVEVAAFSRDFNLTMGSRANLRRAFSADWRELARRVADRPRGSTRARSPCGVAAPKPRRSARATWHAWNRRPRGSRARADAVRGLGASRRGDEPQMLEILARRLSREFSVRREHRLQRVQNVLSSLLARAALAQGAWNLEDPCHYPAVPIRLVKSDREVDRRHHSHTYDNGRFGCSGRPSRGRGGAVRGNTVATLAAPYASDASAEPR